MTPRLRRPLAVLLLASGTGLWVQLCPAGYYALHIMTTICIYVVLAASINLVLGYAGQISLGHAAFVAVGGYGAALLTTRGGAPFAAAVAGGVVGAFAVGLALGVLCLRLAGAYLAIVTVAFGWIVQILLVNLDGWTGGAEGLLGIPAPRVLGVDLAAPRAMFLLALLCAALVLVFMSLLRDSPTGRAWRLLKEDPLAAAVCGVHVAREKVVAFAASAALAGLAGALQAFSAGALFPVDFGLERSVQMLLAAVVGGLGTAWGPLAGGVLVGGGFQLLSGTEAYQSLIVGLAVVLVCVAAPRGLQSLPGEWRERRRNAAAGRRAGEERA